MKLIDIYGSAVSKTHAQTVLWDLLNERNPRESISHKEMPTWEKHCNFVLSRPFEALYLIKGTGDLVGACYLSKQRELGIGIFKAHRNKGYAYESLTLLMLKHQPGRFLANINPQNEPSIRLFEKLGF